MQATKAVDQITKQALRVSIGDMLGSGAPSARTVMGSPSSRMGMTAHRTR